MLPRNHLMRINEKCGNCWDVLTVRLSLCVMMGVAQKQCLETANSLSRSHTAWAVTKLLISSGKNHLFSSMGNGTCRYLSSQPSLKVFTLGIYLSKI